MHILYKCEKAFSDGLIIKTFVVSVRFGGKATAGWHCRQATLLLGNF